jgi:cell division protein FtsZ
MEFNMPKGENSIIKVIGVGGGGSNAVNHMFNEGIKGVDFIVCNTDKQALDISPVPSRVQLGTSLTEGRGAGSIPDVGMNAAIENIEDIKKLLDGTKMIFVTAGMGGGTGTGAAPVIAATARELGILTVGIVTVPFTFEGKKRREQAEIGLEKMRQNVDTLLVINNERLRQISGNLSLASAFAQADTVLATAAKGIAEVISVTGIINVDFNDVNTVLKDSGVAIMGSATAEGTNRAIEAVEKALASPLLNDNDIKGAKYVLLNITYGAPDLLMDEMSAITDYIQDAAGSSADVIWGYGQDETLGAKIGVTIIATGFKAEPVTGFEIEPEQKVNVLEVSSEKKEVTTPMSTPVSNAVAPSLDAEPFIKTIAEEVVVAKSYLETLKEESTVNLTSTRTEETVQATIEFEVTTKLEEETKIIHILDDATENSSLENLASITTISPEEQQKLSFERAERVKVVTAKLKSSDGLNNLESEPAFVRRNISLDESNPAKEENISRFSVEKTEEGTSLKSNNRFLHDNVD